jgi:hypothetical protein
MLGKSLPVYELDHIHKAEIEKLICSHMYFKRLERVTL